MTAEPRSLPLRWSLLGLAFSVLLGLLPPATASCQPAPTDRPDAWREDLEYLASVLPRVHADAFHTLARSEFGRRVDELRRRLPALSDPEIIVEVGRLVAAIGDGHTRLEFAAGSQGVPEDPARGFRPFPLRLQQFADGLYVRSAAVRYENVAGGKVLRVGEAETEDALRAAGTVAHHDNPMLVRFLAPIMLTRPAVLYTLGLSRRLDGAQWTVESPTGDTLTLTLTPASSTDDATAVGARGSGEVPLYLRRPERNYWLTRLDGGRTVYFRYRQVRDEEDEPISNFAHRLEDELRQDRTRRLIVDLRGNDGGNGRLNRPLLHAILRAPFVLQRGRLYVATGPVTFSAGMRFAVDLETHTPAIFVGMPTGSRPNQYGELEQFALPNSGLRVSYSSQYFQSADPLDRRRWIGPDLAAEPTWNDYRKGRDPVLETIRAHPARAPSLRERIADAVEEGGVDAAVDLYRAWRSDPVRRFARSEEELTSLAYDLWLAGRPRDAEPIFELAAEENPDSFEAQENLGEIYAANGNLLRALDHTLRSLELNPGNGDAISDLRSLCREADGLDEALISLDFSRPEGGDVVRSLCRPVLDTAP